MASTGQNRTLRRRRFRRQVRGLRLLSPGDATYVLASLFLGCMQLLPASRRVWMISKSSALLANLLYATNTHSAIRIRENLVAMLGPDRSSDLVEADVRRLLSVIVWNSLMINSLPVLPRSQIEDLVRLEGISCLDDYLATGHPVLICSYHFGVHPVVVAAILHARGYPIHAVTHARQMPVAASVFQRLYLRRLRRIGDQFPVIDPREGLKRDMLDVFRNKECLYITPDYMIAMDEMAFKSNFDVSIDFLGRRTCLQTGGFRLAKRLGAKAVTVLSTQTEKDERRLVIQPFDYPTSGLTPAELQQDLQMCIGRLESQVLARPDLWLDLKRDDLLRRLRPIS